MLPYKVLIFDFDGTLCNTEQAILFTFRKTFAQMGVALPPEDDIRKAIGTGGNLSMLLPTLLPSLAEDQTGQTLANWVKLYRHIYDTEGGQLTTLFSGVKELLQTLKDKQVACVVLSNKGQQAIEDALEHFHLKSYFNLIIGDNPARFLEKKPHPMAFQKVIRPAYPRVAIEQFLMVGDTDADLEFANNAGIASCWAAFGYGNPTHCQKASPTHTIQNLLEITDW